MTFENFGCDSTEPFARDLLLQKAKISILPST